MYVVVRNKSDNEIDMVSILKLVEHMPLTKLELQGYSKIYPLSFTDSLLIHI